MRREPARSAKAKSHAPANKSMRNIVILMVGVGVCVVVAVVTAVAIIAPRVAKKVTEAPVVEIPNEFEHFEVEEGAATFDYPKGWTVEHGGGTGGIPPWVNLKTSGVSMTVRASISKSAIGDMFNAASNQAQGPLPPHLEPVHQVHELGAEILRRENPNYSETMPEQIKMKIGTGRISEFSEGGAFGSVGYRVTLPTGGKYQYTVTCKVGKANFEILKPTLRRIIESIGNTPYKPPGKR